jgi:hypothetical protein
VTLEITGAPSAATIQVQLDEIEQVEPHLENVGTPAQRYSPVTVGPTGAAQITFVWPQQYLSCAGTAVMAPPASCRRPWKLHHTAVVFACYTTPEGQTSCVKRKLQVDPKPHRT